METLDENYRKDGLVIYMIIGLGKNSFKRMKELADKGKGTCLEAMDGIVLREAFVEISAMNPITIGEIV